MVNLQADIIPGASAAGFVLGNRYSPSQFSDITLWDQSKGPLGAAIASTEGWLRVDMSQLALADSNSHALHCHKGAVELKFNSAGVLYCISVYAGYLGKYAGDIGVSDRLASVTRHFPLSFDSGEELHFPAVDSGVSGIAFLATPTPLAEDTDQTIVGITVYNWDLQ